MASADQTATVDEALNAGNAHAAGDTLAPSRFGLSLETFKQLNANQRIGVIVAISLIIALLVGGWLWSQEEEYGVLFSSLSEKDGGDVVAALQQMNIPYKLSPGGTTITIPAAKVPDARLRLATQGLPKGGLVGFEVMENQKLGASQFQEQVNYQRALEGELSRSIQTLQAVLSARVHLAIPKTSAFLRDEQKPSASIVLNLQPGRLLDPGQIAGIVHLVSSSVPQLTPANISVVDQQGNLLSKQLETERVAGLNPTQLKYLRDLEASIIKRIETILEPVVGNTNLRAQVAADVDFSLTEQTAEYYTPNPSPNTAIRSQQTAESTTTQTSVGGVPGALSNQPPVPATAPITSPPVEGGAAADGSRPLSSSRNATINYELDKTIRHTKGSSGLIKRLSVAVVLNNRKGQPDEAGKLVPQPYSSAEMEQINALVREAMGYDEKRGDTLSVANVAFNVEGKDEGEDLPLWRDPQVRSTLLDMLRDNFKYLVLALLAFLLWRMLLRPLLHPWLLNIEKQRQELEELNKEPEPVVAEEGASETEAPEELTPQQIFDAKLARVRELTLQDPKTVANIIRSWIAGNE